MAIQYWLMKSEPSAYSISDLKRDKKTYWDGVRNYQARNFMRDDMKCGDLVLFYHSNAKPPGIVGLAKVCQEGYPDQSAFDPESKYFDPKSNPNHPTWIHVDIQFVRQFKRIISLNDIKKNIKLSSMKVVQKGSRLSVQPVLAKEFEEILCMADA